MTMHALLLCSLLGRRCWTRKECPFYCTSLPLVSFMQKPKVRAWEPLFVHTYGCLQCEIRWRCCSSHRCCCSVCHTSSMQGAPNQLLKLMPCCLCAAGKRSKPKPAPEAAAPDRRSQRAQPLPPPSFPDIAICNATGVLHHLTFLDQAKVEVTGSVPAACLQLRAPYNTHASAITIKPGSCVTHPPPHPH